MTATAGKTTSGNEEATVNAFSFSAEALDSSEKSFEELMMFFKRKEKKKEEAENVPSHTQQK